MSPASPPVGGAIANDRIIVAVDVGTSKVCTLIADVGEQSPKILGVGVCPSRGIDKGIVVDSDAAAEAISASLRRAEQQSGFKAISAFIGVAGPHIKSTVNHAAVDIERSDHVVTASDVHRAVAAARVLEIPAHQEIIHVIPHHFAVDDLTNLSQPMGLVGRSLAVNAVIVTGAVGPLQQLVKCIESTDVELDALVYTPLAEGYALLSSAERDLGSMVIDMGGGTTGVALFRGGSLIHACGLPVGGYQLSNDVAFGLRVPLEIADAIKVRHGSTIGRARAEGEALPLQPLTGDPDLWVEQCTVAEILDARLAETFELIHDSLTRQGFASCYRAGVVLTGGSARIPGAAELATEIFDVPTRVGAPGQLHGIAEAVRDPTFSASVGLLMWGGDQLRAATAESSRSRIARIGASVRDWLRNFLG